MATCQPQRQSIREVVGIGQVWRHRAPHYLIEIKQIHRADRLVEAWFDDPEGRRAHGVTFRELDHEYELGSPLEEAA